MSEASFEMVLNELREAAPRAPERLREQVRALQPARSRIRPWLRPSLVAAVIVTVVVGALAALVSGPHDTRRERGGLAAESFRPAIPAHQAKTDRAAPNAFGAPTLTAKSRLQRQDVAMTLRVKDLSSSTQSAVRTTRRLGGFVAGADYATRSDEGNSRLALRVPVANLQKAIASFTQLGTILSQHISVADLQSGLDRLDARIAKARHAGHARTVARLERRRDALIREGTYAHVSLQLTTAKPAAKNVVPGRFDRFWDNTSEILGKELIAVLYALVVAGPFVLIAALLVLGERTRRRRSDHRLLEETG
jgi:Domain of unknown function (DUF4349)